MISILWLEKVILDISSLKFCGFCDSVISFLVPCVLENISLYFCLVESFLYNRYIKLVSFVDLFYILILIYQFLIQVN